MAPPFRKAIETIPEHLRPYVAEQDVSRYTAIDHACWRYILKISQALFSAKAHPKYQEGLRLTGISTERIPLITEMDECLKRFGWRAVGVNGFIPPAIFMEFQSLGILPIACEMRTAEHLAYTPAPDIVHEAAGHAPILADPEYAAYLREYGEISRKAVYSNKDMQVYEAIRVLSDVKEDPQSTPEQITQAQENLETAVASVDYISEASYLARMFWWTVEYGLVGSLQEPLIYGAGLLSSVSESYSCLEAGVAKIPFTLDCVNMSYDITRPQPQLFVTPDFQSLSVALHAFAQTMAFKRGGLEGLSKARVAGSVTTAVLDSGLQISGVLTGILLDQEGQPAYLNYSGPSQLAIGDQELLGHSAKTHREGFGTALGAVKVGSQLLSAHELTQKTLESLGFFPKKSARLEYSSGVVVEGQLKGVMTNAAGGSVVLSFDQCTVTLGARVLFKPEWGTYDLALGTVVTSVFGGPADRALYSRALGGSKVYPSNPKTNLTAQNRELNDLYAQVRSVRETSGDLAVLGVVEEKLEKNYPLDWLLRFELLEIFTAKKMRPPFEKRVRERLTAIAQKNSNDGRLIERGLKLLVNE